MEPFGRLVTAMLTPFTREGAVDYPRARQLAEALVATGTSALVVCGTTGEAPTLTKDEKLRLVGEVKQAIRGRAPIIAGTCSNNTADSIELSREALRTGADAILGTVPWYNNPPQEGLERHFQAIADAVAAPIMLYNVPSRTATNLAPETAIRLSHVPNIVGIKEASGKLEAIGTIIRGCRPGFLVWSGNDADTLPVLAIGGYGVVSVASHLVGRQIALLMEHAVAGDLSGAAGLHQRLMPLFSALFATTSPIPLKYAMRKIGLDCGGLRLPLVEIDARSAAIVDAALQTIEVDIRGAVAA